jgi:hypothetical protein
MFKYKIKKQNNTKNNTTLDIEHMNKEKHFTNRKETLPSLKIKLDELENEYNNKTLYDLQYKSKIKDDISVLKQEIYNIENNIDELNYYTSIFDILIDYYDESNNNNNNNMANNILDCFKSDKQNNKTINKASLFNNYKTIINGTYNKNKDVNVIKYCNDCNIEKILNQSEGIYECIKCGESEIIIVESDIANYKDQIPDVTNYAYKRINHQPNVNNIIFRWLTVSYLLLCDVNNKVNSETSYIDF